MILLLEYDSHNSLLILNIEFKKNFDDIHSSKSFDDICFQSK